MHTDDLKSSYISILSLLDYLVYMYSPTVYIALLSTKIIQHSIVKIIFKEQVNILCTLFMPECQIIFLVPRNKILSECYSEGIEYCFSVSRRLEMNRV